MVDNGDDISRPDRPSRLAELADWPAPAEAAAPQAALEPPEVSAPEPSPTPEDELAAARRQFAVLLGEFRRAAVLVPIDEYGSLWSADQGGVRWICAFSDEEALARFARAQGDAEREWMYHTLLGARLLDVMVPKLGVPAGVALDAGSEDGMLFPPVAGIVPDAVAVDLGGVG
ncbi:SseB family protein [Streptomyces sp. NBC_01142]|uniref:SseB family protein n=1 Tax=Streptomyces sp. NBC_01142 TaxID=2975865 RepID=UPI00225A2DDE|nr:SseB family protein [Streptomyces sp. NBC_01142]MCX4823788.1 SseB family protein [Streptomyces sp. NBC_01142]